MESIALLPPRPRLDIPRKQPTVPTCSSCEGPVNASGECRGCTK